MKKTNLFYLITISYLLSSTIFSTPAPIDLSIDDVQVQITINHDLTYHIDTTETDSYYTEKAVQNNKFAAQEFDPDLQTLKVLEAYVLMPNGQKIPVNSSSIYVRPSDTTQAAPQFSNRQIMSVVFPQIIPGSKTYVHWQFTQKKPSPFGFNFFNGFPYNAAIKKAEITITAPSTIPLHYMTRGPVHVTQNNNQENTLTATLENQLPQLTEANLPPGSYFESFFAATTIPSWTAYGNIWNQLIANKAETTPTLTALAKQLTKNQTSSEAVATLYNFVVQKIRLLPVAIHDLSYEKIPTAAEVLQAGFADPRGKAILLSALYQALNIPHQIAVSSNSDFSNYPYPVLSAMNNMMVYLNDSAEYVDSSSQLESFAVLSTGVSDQLAVLLSKQSTVNQTPTENPEKNTYHNQLQLLLTPQGSFNGENTLSFTGNLNGLARNTLYSENPSLNYNQMLGKTDTGGTGTIRYSNPNNFNQNVMVQGRWESPKVIELGKTAVFLLPSGYDEFPLIEFRTAIPEITRSFPFLLGARTMRWTDSLTIPPGYQVIRAPQDVRLKNAVGTYQSHYQFKGNQLEAQRILVFSQKMYPATLYPVFQQLITAAVQDAQSVIQIRLRS